MKMPKIKNEYPEENEDELEEAEELDEEEELERPPVKKALPQLPKLKPIVKEEKRGRPPKRRYTAFIQQSAEGIVDTETNEAMSELEALARIMESQERIESKIGELSS